MNKTFNGFTTNTGTFRLCGGGLMFEMPDAAHTTIRKVLGTSLSTERKEKYSNSIFVKHVDTGFIYSVYMCFGQWRIGAVDTKFSEDKQLNSTYNSIGMQLRDILNH